MAKTKRVTDKEIAECLEVNKGMVGAVAKALGYTSAGIYKRISESKMLQDVKKEIEHEFLDFAEGMLIKKIKDENLGAIIFYLKCKGKERGWVERKEITGGDGEPLVATGVMVLPALKDDGAGFDKDKHVGTA